MKKLRSKSYFNTIVVLFVFVISFCIGFLRMQLHVERINQLVRDGEIGYVVRPPLFRNGQQILILELGNGRPVKAFLPILPEYQRGQYLRIEGFNNGEVLYNPGIQVFSDPNFFVIFLNTIHDYLTKAALIGFSEPYDSLVLGMVFGIDFGLDSRIYELMNSAGLLHILVASGYNVALLQSLCGKLLRNFGKLVLSISIVVLIILYGSLSGYESPIIRASVMGLGSMIAIILGRLWIYMVGLYRLNNATNLAKRMAVSIFPA